MAETALKFGPEWLRALSHGNNVSSPPTSPEIPMPKYKLADYRYGREEMLALFSKDSKSPDSLNEFQYLIEEKCQMPLALLPVTEEEQRIWSRSINSDVALRVSGKGGIVTGNGLPRGGRGGSVDRGRGRGRGGYYQRGLSFEDGEEGPPGGFSRPRPIERSQSASEKDQRWDDRDRRFDRPFSGRTGVLEENNGLAKQDGSRAPLDNWRKTEKEDESGWRTAGVRGVDKLAGRGSWRNHDDRDRNHDDLNKNKSLHNHDSVMNGPVKSASHHPGQRSGNFWDDDMTGDNLPEWSVEESNDTDIVGTFDATGAFLETKVADDVNTDDIYASDDGEECSPVKESPEPKPPVKFKIVTTQKSSASKPVPNKAPVIKNMQPTMKLEETTVIPHVHKSKSLDSSEKHCESEKLLDKMPLPSIPEQNSIIPEKVFSSNSSLVMPPDLKKSLSLNMVVPGRDIPAPIEEDAFAHHQKATENMVAQWTEEEEQQVMGHSVDKTTVLPPHHEDAHKWFYRDPQGEVQGPFPSNEMLEWFRSGYFTMNLMVRRGCDELFSQLGELIKTWGRIPFLSGNSPAPLRVTPITTTLNTPMTQTIVPNPSQPTLSSAQQPKQDAQLRLLQQQLLQQQIMQQQLILRHAQMQQLLGQLKQQDTFTSLNPQQQQHQLLQQFLAQQQIPRSGVNAMGDQSNSLETMPTLPLPLLGLTVPPLLKNDLSLWGVTPGAGTWPAVPAATQPPGGSIWDADPSATVIEASELEKQHKQMAAEEDEKRRKAEERQRLEEEHKQREEEKRKHEELKRKQEEERLRKEIQKQEEERKRLEELKHQEEEKRKQEELKRLEEQRRRQEEIRLEELRKKEEQQKLEELKRQAELEEERKKELLRKQEEQKRLEQLKRQEEQRKQDEKRKQEELQKLLWEKEQERVQEIERQKEALRQKECEFQKERERQREFELQRELENNQRLLEQKLKAQGPVWGIQNATKTNLELSLSDIQRLQEEKEKEEKEKIKQQQLRQQSLQQVQPTKNGLSWGNRSNGCNTSVKSLAEIQQEEANRMAQQQKVQKPVTTIPPLTSNLGVWGNSTSQLNRVTLAPVWNLDVSSGGFWDDALNSTTARKPTPKTNDSAFPALSNLVQPANVNSNKSKHVRAKKDEDAVMRLFETHRKPNDEFTTWCTDALCNLPSSVDVPTFVAFLKDIESPYEVFDYVKSYLGEGKEAREFGKQFLERRSKYRNQAKQSPAEENLWGPAPALSPSISKPLIPAANDCDGTACTKGKTKKRKNRMQRMDSSMLGFTVQSNPDRINVGEIDHVEGM